MHEVFIFLLGVALGALLRGPSRTPQKGDHVNHGPIHERPDLPPSAARPSKTRDLPPAPKWGQDNEEDP